MKTLFDEIFRDRFSVIEFALGTSAACAAGMSRWTEAGILAAGLIISAIAIGFVNGMRKGLRK